MNSLSALSPGQWLLAGAAALCVGLSKSGFGGMALLTIILMAEVMPARESTGAVLPLLIVGDVFAVAMFRRHAQWPFLWRTVPPAFAGIIVAYFFMPRLPAGVFRPVIGWIVLLMVFLQLARELRPGAFQSVPRSRLFAWLMGGWAGVTTMLANAAGAVMTLYLVANRLPKMEFVGTAAWFFLLINVFKVPFSYDLGLISSNSLTLNLLLTPLVLAGLWLGSSLLPHVPQKLFEQLLLVFTGIAALRLIGLF